MSRQQEINAELSKELSAMKDHKKEINELRLIVNELRTELKRAKDSESKARSRNTELSQALDNKEGQLEVNHQHNVISYASPGANLRPMQIKQHQSIIFLQNCLFPRFT